MDIDRLRYFTVLCESGSMREAAELLRISQPALSKAMKLLESELGETLYLPSGRGIMITDKGRRISARARQVLSDLDQITSEDSQNENHRVRIGSFEVFTTYFFGEIASKVLSEFEVDLYELLPGQIEERVASGAVDIGINYLPVPHPNLDFYKITQIEMGLYAGKGTFKNAPFSERPFVVPIAPVHGSPHKVKGLDGWPDDRYPRKTIYRVDLMETALELCRRGLAVAYLPRFVVSLHNRQMKTIYQLRSLKLPMEHHLKKQDVFLIKRKSDIESRAFSRIGSALRSLS